MTPLDAIKANAEKLREMETICVNGTWLADKIETRILLAFLANDATKIANDIIRMVAAIEVLKLHLHSLYFYSCTACEDNMAMRDKALAQADRILSGEKG